MELQLKKMGRHVRAGFTMVELLVVVSIIAMSALFAIPYLSGRGDFDAQAAARQFIADVAFAQGDAIARQDSAGARQAMRTHLDNGMARYRKLLGDL
jgi:prepilin-type N-terminal cleavage/methylation domain-containing protein